MKLLSDPPPKRSGEDILFDYLDPEERRIYTDLARRRRDSKSWKAKSLSDATAAASSS